MVRKNGSQLLEVWSPVDMDDDEPERPSTSWEPTKAYLGREELSLEEIEGVRERFREQCIRQHGSVVRAWKVMDLNADGRLSYFEFMRGCKQMSVANPRRVWRALGRTGLLTLRCVDPRLGEQLGTLATAIWFNCGSVENAWRSCFNKRSKLRISSEDFSEACQELRYQGDPVACFGELCSEKASNGMSRKEFGFLHSWMSPKGHPDRGFLDAPISKWAVPAEPWTPPPIVQKRDERREKFLDCLLRSYGNIVRAWREGLDRNHDDRMDYQEFSVAIKDVGYAGNAKELWEERSTPQRCMGGWAWSPRSPCELVSGRRKDAMSATAGTAAWWTVLERFAAEDRGCDSAVGCLLGLTLGDAVGAPLEFCAVDPSPLEGFEDDRRPCVAAKLREGQLHYKNVRNKFELKLGQWTDDASMALCLADSLLTCGKYDGGDARLRWHMWWFHGYCNAFRYDMERRKGQTSVGLGSNVAKSFVEIERSVQLAHAQDRLPKGTSHATVVPPVHQSDSNDAGNGSIMRLAPVPIAYHLCPAQALDVAAWQSLATHPGPEAALCCRFMASFCVEAISRHRNAGKVSDSELAVLDPIGETRSFMAQHIERFLKDSENFRLPPGLDDGGANLQRLKKLLMSSPPSKKEAHWNWKAKNLAINEGIAARRGPSGNDLYNGHPTTPGYFGAYCMDGLAMALWALWNSNSFAHALLNAVNLLGDADTVGAIVGQMAGALYGFKRIISDEWSVRCVKNLMHWDKGAEIGLRAVLLYHRGPRPRAQLKASAPTRGAPASSMVPLFDQPNGARRGLAPAGELPVGDWVTCTDAVDGSYKIYHDTGLQGWVGPYDIAEFTPAAGTEDLTKYLVDPAVRRAAAAAAAPRAPRARDDASPPPIPTEPELDGETARLLREFVDSAKSSYGSFMAFWNEALDIRHDDRVLYPEFRDGCLMLGWNPRDVGRLFELLDTDRARYLSWATTSWLSGAELVDGDSGSPRIARPRSPEAEEAEAEGAKVKFTKAQSRRMHQRLREHRHRVKCYEGRARNEIPGSHPSAGTTIYSSAPFITQTGSKNPSTRQKSKPFLMQSRVLCPEMPEWLLVAEGSKRMPLLPEKLDLSFPLKPQQPGKGGWPTSKLFLVDELWGGSKDLGLLLRPQTRQACSQPNLDRWKRMAAER
ncbi:unnamed protein product [Durusdinium trenchii]|uniref:EF-hand domain-containing protein n=1 Tax=Durusdinium trenchii TaxID=1381693 RepID=A0ABP0S2P9_9DINO